LYPSTRKCCIIFGYYNSILSSVRFTQLLLYLFAGCINFVHNLPATVLTWSGDLREAQVDIPLSVSYSCVWPHRWAL